MTTLYKKAFSLSPLSALRKQAAMLSEGLWRKPYGKELWLLGTDSGLQLTSSWKPGPSVLQPQEPVVAKTS